MFISDITQCNNIFENIAGSGGLPIEYYNSSVNLENRKFSQLILCNADNSNLKNITIESNDGIKNNGLFMYYTENSNFTNINSSNNYYGLYSTNSNNNQFINTSLKDSWSGYSEFNQDINLISSSGINYFREFYNIGGYRFESFLGFSNEHGEIIFLNKLFIGGNSFYNYISGINNNSVYFPSPFPANITLNNLPINFKNPMIYNGNQPCGVGCYNSTSLNAGNVRFNVTSAGNYSVREAPNTAPTIDSWTINSGSPLSCLPTSINHANNNFKISISDSNGVGDLVDGGEVKVYFEKNSNIYRPPTAPTIPAICTYYSDNGINTAYFDCSVNMNYYDEPGDWIIHVSATDGELNAINNGQISLGSGHATYPNFYYNTLADVRLTDTNGGESAIIEWNNPAITVSTINQKANTNLIIENCGNVNINLQATAQDLDGDSYPADKVAANSFSASVNPIPCDNGQIFDNIEPLDFVNIDNSFISKSIDGIPQNKNLYFCLEEIKKDSELLRADTYNSVSPWDITGVQVFILSIIKSIGFNFDITLVLSVVVVRVKRKKKNKKSSELDYESLLSLDLLLKSKYKTSIKDLLKEAERKESDEIKIEVPISIFRDRLSPAEALCKYMKENLEMRYSEISKMINRNERSVWTNYNNAIKKSAEKIIYKTSEKQLLINIEIISNRKLSILESLVKYLKEKGYRNVDIAEMLGKDQRNVYTLYNRAMKKMR